MDGKERLEQGLRQGIPLWRIEDEMDWEENAAATRQTALFREARDPTARGRSAWQPLFFLFGWFFNRVLHTMKLRFSRNHRQ